MRRSPLIDALHPEVARQRAFQLQLRQARQRGTPSPSPRLANPEDKSFQDATVFLPEGLPEALPEAAAAPGAADPIATATTATTPTNAASRSEGPRSRNRRAVTTLVSTPPATARVSPTTAGAARVRHPRRPRGPEPASSPGSIHVPVPAPPSPAVEPSRSLLVPTGGPKAAAGAGGGGPVCGVLADGADADANDVVAPAGGLSALQVSSARYVKRELELGQEVREPLGLGTVSVRSASGDRCTTPIVGRRGTCWHVWLWSCSG